MNKRWVGRYNRGFTVVELIVIIMVIGILASIASISYGRSQSRSRITTYKNDIDQVRIMIEAYRNEHGEYPSTTDLPDKVNWHAIDVLIDSQCSTTGGSARVAEWVPDLDEDLPQSNVVAGAGVDEIPGCYAYASNGTDFVLSAWNVYDAPSTIDGGYRRLGFRQFTASEMSTQFYTCNSSVVGGGSYDALQDYYKYSYTLSNITDCDETPPAGA